MRRCVIGSLNILFILYTSDSINDSVDMNVISLDLLQLIETQSRMLVSVKAIVLEGIHGLADSRVTMYPQRDRSLIVSDRARMVGIGGISHARFRDNMNTEEVQGWYQVARQEQIFSMVHQQDTRLTKRTIPHLPSPILHRWSPRQRGLQLLLLLAVITIQVLHLISCLLGVLHVFPRPAVPGLGSPVCRFTQVLRDLADLPLFATQDFVSLRALR